jgi:ascorbate-specific PTS system EIIC-type component UlaA
MSLGDLTKSAAIVSSAGVALMVAFVVILLVFPVIKKCDEEGECSYQSTAPAQLQSIVQPTYLAISLLTISAGVLMLRLSRWREREKTRGAS